MLKIAKAPISTMMSATSACDEESRPVSGKTLIGNVELLADTAVVVVGARVVVVVVVAGTVVVVVA